MTDYLALAAQAAGDFDSHVTLYDWSSFIMMAGFIALHAIIPLISGLIYAHHWRILLMWVAALAGASYALQAGQELFNANSGAYDSLDALTFSAVLVLVPAFGAAGIGILLRKMWDRRKAEYMAPEVQK